MKDYKTEVFFQDYKAILSLFNDFDTASEENFKSMLDELQIPFVYDNETDLASNRLHFKMFFSCLTKIRCAVVEGSHRLKSSSRLLQGFSLGSPIPLRMDADQLPPGCTVFKPVQTNVYDRLDKGLVLGQKARKVLRIISKKISEDKKRIVKDSWAQWMTNVLDEIVTHEDLQKVLYNYQNEFWLEDVYHWDISKDIIRSNKIKKYLHEILTNAIFESYPCKELLLHVKKKPPNWEEWSGSQVYWESLNANPFHKVSPKLCCLFM